MKNKSRRRLSRLCLVTSVLLAGGPLLAQPLSEIPFDQIPTDSQLVAPSIHLDGDVTVSGEVETSAGVRFPDGSLQATAASAASVTDSVTANSGLYSNKIADFTPPAGYVEVCFKGGVVLSDFHGMSESTAGGNCVPGDTGWVIERDERTAALWQDARASCLAHGIRLPEPFEWTYTCDQAAMFGVNDMTGNYEWASNRASSVSVSSFVDLSAPILGLNSCSWALRGEIARNDGTRTTFVFRCAR